MISPRRLLESHREKSRLEKEFPPESIGIATTTMYPKWYPGNVADVTVDKIRGDLALQMIQETKKKGYKIKVIDGMSSEAFHKALKGLGVDPIQESEQSMSESRRQAYREISAVDGVKVIVWVDPEKVSAVKDCIVKGMSPIAKGEADIVIGKRNEQAWETYPKHQVEYEKKANSLWNKIMRKHNLLTEKDEDLDMWFGLRFFKNEPEILKLLFDKYELAPTGLNLDKITDPEKWPNAHFLPTVAALSKGLKVISATVPYRHPKSQTKLEERDSDDFRRKRDIQYKSIILNTMHLIKLLEKNPKSRLHRADEEKQ